MTDEVQVNAGLSARRVRWGGLALEKSDYGAHANVGARLDEKQAAHVRQVRPRETSTKILGSVARVDGINWSRVARVYASGLGHAGHE